MTKTITICRPNGFCAGVERAIKIVDLALEAYGAPIYVNHEIVHNQHVVDDLASKGAVFVDDLNDVPMGAKLIYSAHGVSPEVREKATTRGLEEIDATCPLVTKVHLEAIRFAKKGYHIFLIGHANHVEVIGTYGEVPDHITIVEPVDGPQLQAQIQALPQPEGEKTIYLTQTTLNVDDCMTVVKALKHRFPNLESPPKDDICYATSNRQNAVKAVAPHVDYFIVVGSPTSSNSRRLVEVARSLGCNADLIPSAAEMDSIDLKQVQHIGITAGASTPDILVQGIIHKLKQAGFSEVKESEFVEENMSFSLPKDFRSDLATRGIPV
ncbi:MAG: 4-hydroxy-3-methylbut-2-enyl diphosphate reductase [Acidobacteria bacterium]|nr:4-hydroxy-3-methylbut-2-enyl diphosphate reductase [Acidobacteriota bacterium]